MLLRYIPNLVFSEVRSPNIGRLVTKKFPKNTELIPKVSYIYCKYTGKSNQRLKNFNSNSADIAPTERPNHRP
jgi:hypothetical protein